MLLAAAAWWRPDCASAFQGGLSFLEPPEPAPLPGAPIVDRYLLENPWPLVVLLALASVVVFTVVRGRRSARESAAYGAAPLAAGALVLVVARLVETPTEKLRASTIALVSSAARAEGDRVGELLAPDAVLFPPGGGTPLNRDRILARVREDLGDRWRLREWAVLDVQGAPAGNSGRTQVKIRATPEAVGFPNISWWRIGWRRDPAGEWRVISIEPASVTTEVERELR